MKPTQPLFKALKRMALTTKSTNKGYYKGTGSGSMGRHTKHGGYVIEYEKVRTYVVPDAETLEDCGLSPFVTKSLEPAVGRFEGDPMGAMSGQRYYDLWKAEGQL